MSVPRDHHRDPAAPGTPRAPVDPDVDVPPWPPGTGRVPRQFEILAAIAAGGVLGACARYGAVVLSPTAPGAFPWTTFWINITGCAVMGALMVLITDRRTVHPLVRPFLGTGVLGGYTTFSTYALDAQHLIDGGRAGTAVLYLAVTLLAALAAVWGASALTRLLVPTRPTRDGAAG
ncbi:fluoride efflux transporter CrcB [Micromonospora sp. NPDC003241]